MRESVWEDTVQGQEACGKLMGERGPGAAYMLAAGVQRRSRKRSLSRGSGSKCRQKG